MKKVIKVYKKEIKELFRDKKTLFMSIFFPIVIYPLMILISSFLTIVGAERIDKSITTIAFDSNISQELIEIFSLDNSFELVESENFRVEIASANLDLYLAKEEERYLAYYDSTKEAGREAIGRLMKKLDSYRDKEKLRYLESYGIDTEYYNNILKVEGENIAKEGEVGRSVTALVLPILLIFPMLMAVLYSALDLSSGEKERKTLETLMTLPVSKDEILVAKLFATVSMGFFSALVNITALAGTAFAIAKVSTDYSDFIFGSLSIGFILIIVISIVPLIFFLSALCLIAGIISKDYKEAQNYASPIMILTLIPIYFVISPGWNLEGYLAFIPILNVFLLFKSVGAGIYSLGSVLLVFFTNTSVAIASMIVFGRLFTSENILFSEERAFNFSLKRVKETRREGLEINEVILVFILNLIALLIFGSVLQIRYGILGVFATQILLILLPSILILYLLNIDIKIMKLKKVELKTYIGSIGVWFIGFIIVAIYAMIQNLIFPQSMESLEVLSEFLSETNIYESIFFLSLTPAICEEVFFRGLIYGSLEKKMSPKWAILISSILFGVFHIYPAKIITTALLGVIFAYMVYLTGSIYPAILMHFVNNFFALVIGERFQDIEFITRYSSYIFIVFITLVVIGVRWILKNAKSLN